MRYAFVALTTATALCVAGCGSSGNPAPAASKSSSSASTSATGSTPAPQAAHGKDRVAGIIASVSGNTVAVTEKDATATVNVTSSTKVAELAPAQLTDLTPGSCVTVRFPHDNPAGPARTVVISTPANGTCNPPKNARPGTVRGSVASVNGNTVVVAVGQNGSTSPTNVTVDDTTRYAKRAPATTSAIAQGKCLAARGTKDASGALQATTATVAPADNGNCPGSRR